ncbi:transmembrane protein 231 [Stylonychia lemnae]|uniref:Transmembrane protein 231 n=1 Tax=Stylonychia lemnae TaxID=5949 RepID=A0A078AUK7_STYLE|nr:transmembrane protein 231 [Stylonychia lemnae]|eukprot:CDW84907.1 transmembrane protein 231 [Stylonychia lemnae]
MLMLQRTIDMWKKENTYFEQPDVVFTNKLLLEVLDQNGHSKMFSTLKSINQLSTNEIGVPLIKYSKFDSNKNGLIDSMNIRIEFRSNPQEIRNIKLLSSFDYSLSKLLKVEMIGLAYLDIDTPNGASGVIVNGQLNLDQSAPVLIDSVKRTLYNTDPLDDYSVYTVPDLIEFYQDRKGNFQYPLFFDILERTVYNYNYIVQPYGQMFKTTLDVTIKIPFSQEVIYIPGILETLKYAWIQYLSFFLPALLVYFQFVKFMFKYKIVETTIVSDLHKKKYM